MGFILRVTFLVCIIMPDIMADFIMKGIYAPVFTPFHDNGTIDTSVLDDYGKYLSEQPVKGIIVASTTGEGPNLSEAEKKLLFKSWKPIARKYKLQMVVQIGGGSEGEMIALAKYCNCLKVDAIIVQSTVYFRPNTIEQLSQLLEAVAKTAPTIPIQYIDYPKFTKVELNMPALFTLATERIPNFMGMTVDLPTAVQISAVNTLKSYQTICIRDNILITAAAFLGYRCFETTINNISPLGVAHAIHHGIKGESEFAIFSQTGINKASAEIVKIGGDRLNSNKAAIEIYTGIKLGDPRIPFQPVSAEDREKIKTVTDTIDALVNHGYELTPEDLEEL